MRQLHRVVVGAGWVGAAEFWTLPPAQLWWVVEDRLPPAALTAASDRDEMLMMLRKAKRHAQPA